MKIFSGFKNWIFKRSKPPEKPSANPCASAPSEAPPKTILIDVCADIKRIIEGYLDGLEMLSDGGPHKKHHEELIDELEYLSLQAITWRGSDDEFTEFLKLHIEHHKHLISKSVNERYLKLYDPAAKREPRKEKDPNRGNVDVGFNTLYWSYPLNESEQLERQMADEKRMLFEASPRIYAILKVLELINPPPSFDL